MKRTVVPSMHTVIILGIGVAVCLIITIAGIFTGDSLIFPEILLNLLLIGVFVYETVKYFSKDQIEFDKNSFSVKNKTYSFDEISNITVKEEHISRLKSTLRIDIYIEKNKICSFTKDDTCGKDFIANLKNHGVNVNIDI